MKAENVNLFDWRAVRRWGLPEGDLPTGSMLLYRETTVWESYKWYIIGSISFTVAETLLIFALIWLRAKRRRVEQTLEKSEEKFAKAFHHSPLPKTIKTSKDDRYIDVNEAFLQMTGWSRDEVIGRSPFDLAIWVDPEDRDDLMNRLESGSTVRNLEVRFRIKNGEVRTGLGSAELIEIGGEPCILGVTSDISELKRAEEALSKVSQRLIEAQDEERRRVARELHDDISSQISLILLALERWRTHQSLPAEVREGIAGVVQQAATLGRSVRSLSHRLHSSNLDYLGLAEAASGFCREISAQHKVEVIFQSEDVSTDLSRDVSLCLFRVLQEALQNAIKYSGTRDFHVSLVGATGEIHLTVLDSGIGFDPEKPSRKAASG